ncbi:MAG: carboxypeptidase regulatory-like domain-containing protein, partial [Armatimonadota bacterium]
NLRLDESGSSQDDDDVDRVSLFDDTDDNNEFDPAVDTRIATATFQNQSAFFTDLNYRIPRGETRDVFITYDISDTASSSAGNSLGAGIARFDYIVPKIPGAVQRRVRNDIEDGLGDHRFPIDSAIVEIEEAPDTLTITPISRAPIDQPEEPEQTAGLAIEPGDENVPILSLDCEVDRDSVTIDRVLVDETGTMDAVAHITAARLYLDANADGQVDGGDTLLEETRFADEGGNQRASFDIAANPVRVTDSTPRSLLLTASISEDMPQEEPPLTLQYTLEDTTYISLVQSEDIVSDENFPMSSDVVSTPLPNEPPAPPTNVAASELADGSIQLTWDLSADDPAVGGEEDVVHYNIYRSTDPADFVDVSPADAYSTAEAGETEFTDLDAPLNVDLYYMMRAWDGVQEGPDSNVAGPVQAQDNAAPVFSDFDPEQGAEGVAEDTTIAFTVSDGASGVDQATLVFEVDGEDVSEAPETTISGSAAELRVEYDPPEDFDFLQTVAVRLQAADNAGNMSDEITYEFTVTGPPVHFIAGVITDADGNPEESVRVEAGDAFDMTDANGEYQIEGLSAGTYTVTPSKDGRSFQPEQRSVTVPPDVVEIDFTSQLGFDISGTVVTEDGDPLEGVTVTDGTHADTTGADGAWELVNVPAGTYGIVADLEGWTFEPAEISVTVNEDAGDSTGNVFTASIEVFAIGGTVRTLAGNRLAGIDVEALQDDEVLSTATTNANGVYQIDGLAPGSYLVRPVDDNYAFDPEDRQVDLTTDLVDIDFAAASLYTMTLPAGLGFVAVPVEPLHPEPENVFGDDVEVARWDPDAGEYAFAPSDNSVMQVRPGAGFWTRSAAATQLEVPGTAFSNTESLSLTAHRTWTMFGNPYDRGLPWEQVAIPEGGAVSSYGFIWDADANTYRLVSTAPGLGAVTVVPKHAGFWLRSISATQIEIEAPGTAPASAEVAEQVARKPADDAWIIPIVARGGGALDACSFAGVLPQAASDPAAYRMDNPPAVGSHVDLYFVGDGGRRLAVDVRGERPVQTWQFEVATDMPDTRVEVQMPDLSEVPNDKSVYLVDETAGKRMYARTLTTYSYDSGEGGARRFTLEVGDRSETGLMITAASAQAAGGAVSVSYTLSADAQVSVEVLNIAGRKIATLADGETAPAGLSTCGWNARNSSGSLVPNGRYLVLVEARADDGQQVQALVPVQLER